MVGKGTLNGDVRSVMNVLVVVSVVSSKAIRSILIFFALNGAC